MIFLRDSHFYLPLIPLHALPMDGFQIFWMMAQKTEMKWLQNNTPIIILHAFKSANTSLKMFYCPSVKPYDIVSF